MLWTRVVLLAVWGWTQWVLADVKFTMLYITNPVIYTGAPFQIVWTGAQGLVDVSLVDAVDGSKTLVLPKGSGTTFNWVPLESLNGHRGSLVITDGLSTDTTAVFNFKDRSEEGVVSSPSSPQSQPSSTPTSLNTPTPPPTALVVNTASVSVSTTTSLQNPTALVIPPTPASSPDSDNTRLSLGTQVGIAIGAILLTAIGAAMLLYLFWFRKRQQALKTSQKMNRDDTESRSGNYAKASPYGSSSSVSEMGNAAPYQSSRPVSELGNAAPYQSSRPVSELGNAALDESSRSVSGLGNAAPHQSSRSVGETQSTVAVSLTSTTWKIPRVPVPPPRMDSETLQRSEGRRKMAEDKSLRSDMFR